MLTGVPLLTTLEPNRLAPTTPIRADRQAEIQVQTGHLRSVSDPPSAGAGRLPPLLEDLHLDIPAPPFSAPTTLGWRNQPESRPSTAPSPSTTSAPSPHPSLPPEFRRQSSVDSLNSSSQSTSSTGESGPRQRRWLPVFGGPKRAQTTPSSSTSDNSDSLPPGIPNGDNSSVRRGVPPPKPPTPSRAQTISAAVASPASPSRSATLPILLPQTYKWELVSPAVLELLEKVASDPEGLLRTATDGSVSAGNLEGLVSRAITGTVDSFKDDRFKVAFLTIYQLFATSERLFEILKRRFVSRGLDPTHARSRYK